MRNKVKRFLKKHPEDVVWDYQHSPYYRDIKPEELYRIDYSNPVLFQKAVECTPNDTPSRRKIWEENPQLVLEGNWYDGHIGENPLDAIIRRENREEMLAAMTDKQREVFIMFYRDCHTQEEIADILKIDRSSVRTRLSYAIKKAKKILQ